MSKAYNNHIQPTKKRCAFFGRLDVREPTSKLGSRLFIWLFNHHTLNLQIFQPLLWLKVGFEQPFPAF